MGITPLELEDPVALRLDLSESKKRERAEAGVRTAMEASQALKATHTFRAFDDGTNPMFMMVHEVGVGCDFDPPFAAPWASRYRLIPFPVTTTSSTGAQPRGCRRRALPLPPRDECRVRDMVPRERRGDSRQHAAAEDAGVPDQHHVRGGMGWADRRALDITSFPPFLRSYNAPHSMFDPGDCLAYLVSSVRTLFASDQGSSTQFLKVRGRKDLYMLAARIAMDVVRLYFKTVTW